MEKKRPCCICRRWFQPDARVGARQCTCGSEHCQRKRRQQTNRRWRRSNPYYDAARRLQSKLDAVSERNDTILPARCAGHLRVGWEVVQAEMGAKAVVIIQQIVRVQSIFAQSKIRSQLLDFERRIGALQRIGVQAEMARGP